MAWLRRASAGLPPFYCIADPDFLAARLKDAGLSPAMEVISDPDETHAVFGSALPVLPVRAPVSSGVAGHPSQRDAASVIEAIERAVADIKDGKARAVVTAPVQKEALYKSGFPFPGHTEFLGELTSTWPGAREPVMMLASETLRVVPLTIHVPLAEVPRLLSVDLIVRTGRIVADELAAKFDIPAPRIAVSGLNPHAGEGGRIGTEERNVIAPAIEELRALGIDAAGPHAADSMFHETARAKYDAALMMYHDQALIPIKTIAFDDAVNVTLGLPLVRTSPDHGTALAIAGTGKANPSSFIAATRMADRMSRAG